MNSSSEVSDDHIIQINQSHEQTPIATSTNSPAPKHESRGVNEMTPEELSSLKVDLRTHICRKEWLKSKQIIEKCPDMVRMPLNDIGDTALHLAAREGSLETVNELVNRMRPEDMIIKDSYGDTTLHEAVRRGSLEIVKELVNRMRPEDMIIPNSYGNTALHLAVREGRGEIVNELVKRMRPEDMLVQNSDGMLPVHLAALPDFNRSIVYILSSRKLIDKMDNKDIERLFFMTIRIKMFDLAIQLFEKLPDTLGIAKNENDRTALNIMLAQKLPEILDMEDKESEAGRLFTKILTQVNQLECNWILKELIPLYDSPVLFHAVKSGCVEVVKTMIDMNCEFQDPKNGRNLLHWVVLFRQKRIFNSIPWTLKKHLVREVDNEGNNILHLAAHLPRVEFEDLSSLTASIQMQRELGWLKFVESNVPRELTRMRNNMGKTPIDVFSEEHKKLSQEIKETAKGIAESGMLVSTLVATVAFAAALTVPGAKTNAWFPVFILTNAVALFASSASLLSFLSNFTSSRFAQSQFVISLHPSLTFGRWLHINSVAAMVVAFIAASFLIFDHTSKWVSYAVASMGLFPILLFLLFQFNFFDEHLWSRYYRLS